MTEIIFGIPSYHRPDCTTYKYLLGLGIRNDNIIIGLNDPKDYKEYKRKHPKANFIINKGNSASFNRNRLLDHINKQCVLLDDDIRTIRKNKKSSTSKYGKLKDLQSSEILPLFQSLFDYTEKCNGKIFGVCATDNTMTMKSRLDTWGLYTPDVVIQGTIMGIVDKELRFDEDFLMVEDYELSCRIIKSGSHTIRRNDLCAMKPKNGTNTGGLHERYENGELEFWLDKACKKYKFLRKNNQQTGAKIVL